MTRTYYYLVSSLPDIALDAGKNIQSLTEFLSEADELVHPDDAALLRIPRYAIDNTNLISLLDKESSDEFKDGGNFSKEELETEIKTTETLPEYMVQFIEAYTEGKTLFPSLSWENQLIRLFYQWLLSHPNDFVRSWYEFDCDCKNVLAALNCRAYGGDDSGPYVLSKVIIDVNEVAQQILKSTAPDFGLSAQLPWLEKVLAADRTSLVDQEKSMDSLRWEMLNELTTFSYFTIETVFAFVLKLHMVERWQRLDPVEGKKRLDALVEELAGSFQLQEDI